MQFEKSFWFNLNTPIHLHTGTNTDLDTLTFKIKRSISNFVSHRTYMYCRRQNQAIFDFHIKSFFLEENPTNLLNFQYENVDCIEIKLTITILDSVCIEWSLSSTLVLHHVAWLSKWCHFQSIYAPMQF